MKDIKALSESKVGGIDEASALQKVKLTHFILEAYPRRDARLLVTKETPQLPQLMFKELLSYLLRRTSVHLSPNSRRVRLHSWKHSNCVIFFDSHLTFCCLPIIVHNGFQMNFCLQSFI